MTPIELVCPTCGTVSYFDEVSRDAGTFCRVCDYPLFWVRSAHLATNGTSSEDVGLRRLPGTAGRVALATIACPSCTEPNPIDASICIRCGADLHPAPPVVVELPPPTAPVPAVRPAAPAKAAIWPWIVLGVLAAVAIALIIFFKVN